MSTIADNIERIKGMLEKAATVAGRNPAEIKIVAVSKTHPPEKILDAYNAGFRVFGENRVQEAMDKIPQLPDDIEWHLVGHLQKNKANKVIHFFSMIQSVDSFELASKLQSILEIEKRSMDILIQVDLAGEETKFGIPENELQDEFEKIINLKRLNTRGLMCLPPYFPDSEAVRPYFIRLRKILNRLNNKYSLNMSELSMGMSNDYLVAIEEGATIVRLGTVIFGERIH